MDTQLFEKNIECLQKRDAFLARQLIEARPVDTYQTVIAKNGMLSIAVKDQKGNSFPLHSLYNPDIEAGRIVDQYKYTCSADLIILGFGLGYHVKEILKRGGNRGFILIVEHDISLLRCAFEHVDLKEVIAHPNVIWSINEPSPKVFNKLKDYGLSILANGVTLLEYTPIVKLFPDYYTQLKTLIGELYTWSKVNVNTQMAKADVFSKNIFSNIIEMVKNPGVNTLFAKFEHVPVFIVSAGPSLDKNLIYLKRIQNKGIIISVGSAANALINNDIIPDLIVSIDFTEHNMKYLGDFNTDLLTLVFDPEVYPGVVERFKGGKFVINLQGKSLCEWFEREVEPKGRLEKGLSVSHTAFLLALAMGASPIIFVGQDLAYTRGAWHNKASSIFQSVKGFAETQRRMQLVPDYFGGEVVTDTALRVFINHFEGLTEGVSVECYNATEGGARIKGMVPISLRDAIVRFCTREIDKSALHTRQDEIDQQEKITMLFNKGKEMLDKLEFYNHTSYEAFELINNMTKELSKPIFESKRVMDLYRELNSKVCLFLKDENILKIMKDNATEALLIRARREEKTPDLSMIQNKAEFIKLLNKEKVFFTVLVRASDFLSHQFCDLLNTINSHYPQKQPVSI